MHPETLKALQGSIKKWERIVACEGQDSGSTNCDLCQTFIMHREVENQCIGCPVHKKTRQILCGGSPYIKWLDHCRRYLDYTVPKALKSFRPRSPERKEAKRLAQVELDFLKSLLPRK